MSDKSDLSNILQIYLEQRTTISHAVSLDSNISGMYVIQNVIRTGTNGEYYFFDKIYRFISIDKNWSDILNQQARTMESIAKATSVMINYLATTTPAHPDSRDTADFWDSIREKYTLGYIDGLCVFHQNGVGGEFFSFIAARDAEKHRSSWVFFLGRELSRMQSIVDSMYLLSEYARQIEPKITEKNGQPFDVSGYFTSTESPSLSISPYRFKKRSN
jgi:hypothetical protein